MKLSDEPAAIPARRQCRDHDEVPVAFLPSRTPKSICLAVHAGVALLHPAIMSAADQLPAPGEESRANRDAALRATVTGFFQRHREHGFMKISIVHVEMII